MKNRSHPSNKNHGSSRSVSNRKNNRNCSFGFGTLFCLTVTITGFLIWSRMNFFTSLLEQTNQLETKPVVDIDKKLRSRDRDVDQKSSSKDIPIINHIHEATSIDNKKKITVDTDKKHSQEKSRKLKIAFAITMNHDGNFQDGAAVLAYSIYATNMTKRHDVSFVAFVHPNVVTSRPVLAKIGYHVIESPTPIK